MRYVNLRFTYLLTYLLTTKNTYWQTGLCYQDWTYTRTKTEQKYQKEAHINRRAAIK